MAKWDGKAVAEGLKRFSDTEWKSIAGDVEAIGMEMDRFFDYVNRETTQQDLKERYGDAWTLADALNSVKPIVSKRDKRRRSSEIVKTDSPEFADEVEKRLAKYLEGATDIQAHDVSLMKQMVASEILAEKWLAALSSDRTNTDDIVSLSNALERARKTIVDIQRTLGIDRKKRQDDAEATSDVEKVLQIIEDAGQWVLENSIKIEHCDTLIGWVVNEFMGHSEMHLAVTCPKCFKVFQVDYVPSEEARNREQEPAWVAEEEALHEADDVTLEANDADAV